MADFEEHESPDPISIMQMQAPHITTTVHTSENLGQNELVFINTPSSSEIREPHACDLLTSHSKEPQTTAETVRNVEIRSPSEIAANIIKIEANDCGEDSVPAKLPKLDTCPAANIDAGSEKERLISTIQSPWYGLLQGKDILSTPVSLKDRQCVQPTQAVDITSLTSRVTQPRRLMSSTPVKRQPFAKKTIPNFIYATHPTNGPQVLYITEPNTLTKEALNAKVQAVTPLLTGAANVQKGLHVVQTLNSSGEENTSLQVSPDTEDRVQDPLAFGLLRSPRPVDEERESHNMKERKRRARIKEACDLMRQLVPGMSEKTDKATVFEFAARYVYFLKNYVGTSHDKDFLIKYSPY